MPCERTFDGPGAITEHGASDGGWLCHTADGVCCRTVAAIVNFVYDRLKESTVRQGATMRHVFGALVLVIAVGGCTFSRGATAGGTTEQNLATAEALIDAFYSFDQTKLRTALIWAPKSVPTIGYYQGWAEGGNYKVLNRAPCVARSQTEVSCSVTVEDDLIPALGLDVKVIDTFHVTFANGRIIGVRTSSNDPPLFSEALEWIKNERPEVVSGPCQGFFDGGPTPHDCVKAVVREFATYTSKRR